MKCFTFLILSILVGISFNVITESFAKEKTLYTNIKKLDLTKESPEVRKKRIGSGYEKLPKNDKDMMDLLVDMVASLSVNKNIVVNAIHADRALEFQVYFHKEDRETVIGLQGVTLRAIRVIMNEISIANEKWVAKKLGRKFDIKKRRLVLVNFMELDD